ncbi:MAG: VWA domain-containing protein [Myxococcales bacterium FL481]|nr:MAG: VWA domain-containing protein [Myxococcales bacterium FL481]
MRRSTPIAFSLVAALTVPACLPGIDLDEGGLGMDGSTTSEAADDESPLDPDASDPEPGTGDGGDHVAPVAFDFDCLTIDRVQEPTIIPPAGLQVGFRVLDCEGDPIGTIPPSSFRVINDVKGEPFGAGYEGGSVSGLGLPSDYAVHTVLALDLSQSIHSSDAVDEMVDGALAFIDRLRAYAGDETHHELALTVFGRPETFELIVDFTTDYDQLIEALEQLRDGPSLGSTDLYGAYMRAVDLVTQRGTDVELTERFVVLMTDGTHEAGDETAMRQQALALKASHPDLNFYSIGIDGAYDAERLEELASTSENFVHVSGSGELTKAFTEVAYRLAAAAHSNYAIGVCTPVSLGDDVSLTIEINLDTASGGNAAATVTVPYPVDELTGDLGACHADDTQGEDPNAPKDELSVILTADNAYGLGWGSSTVLGEYLGAVENVTAGQIFNCSDGPERYTVMREELDGANYIYVAAYADEGVTQGLLGQVEVYNADGELERTVYTGDAGWEVCATGLAFTMGSFGPDEDVLQQQLEACNAASNSGWLGADQGLAVGERNDTPRRHVVPGNEFPITCAEDIDHEARWIWHDWDLDSDASAFITPPGGGNPDDQFLLFRLPVPS